VTRRIRVLQVTHDLGIGGLPRVVETLVRSIDPARFDVHALCLNFAGELADGLSADGYTVRVLPRGAAGRTDYRSSFRVGAFLKAGAYDVVHSHNTQPFFDAAIGALIARRPLLVHTDHARDFPDLFRYMALEHVLSWRAYRVVGVSEHTTENLHRYERISRRRLATIPNGIDERLFERPIDRTALRASLGIPAHATAALFASRLEDQKDVPTLLEAFASVKERLGALHLVIVGQGSRRPDLEARAAALGLGGRVHFAGVRLDVPDLLRASDLFVLSSRWEGLPMVILEAMAARCPIVSTAVGGVPTALVDGESALLVPSGDPAAFAVALERLAVDADLRGRLAAAARRTFDERFSAGVMARRYEQLYVDGCRARGIA
jgi:glycosyltransferase involved in cell wall biosynthesis